MSDHTNQHADGTVREKPTQGIFIGYLALVLIAVALLWLGTGIIIGLTHGTA
jgi:hypothetical protein